MKHIDLFSGIGGFALAARWAGIKTVQFVEIDPFCQKVLAKNFSGVPIHDDIKTFHWPITDTESRNDKEQSGTIITEGSFIEGRKQEIRIEHGGHIDTSRNGLARRNNPTKSEPLILTGGFPCQPYSCAGKRRGKEDDRALWPEMLRIISEAKPNWVIGENVGGFVNMGLEDCISDLEGEGYEVQAFIIPACAVNAPHRRDRVWIVANSGCKYGTGATQRRKLEGQIPCQENASLFERPNGDGREGNATNTTESGLSESRLAGIGELQTETGEGVHDRPEQQDCHAPDTSSKGLQRNEQPGTLGERPGAQGPASECPWNESWLEVATRLCRVDARVSNRVDRLKSLGNAVVPQIPYIIMRVILGA